MSQSKSSDNNSGVTKSPKEYTIDPLPSMYIQMDDISASLIDILDVTKKSQELLNTLLEHQKTIDKTIDSRFESLLKIQENQQKLLTDILGEEKAGADDGAFIEQHGTVTTTDFVILNPLTIIGHGAKGYMIRNDGPNTIRFAHNLTPDGVTMTANDVDANTIRLSTVLNKEEIRFVYNRNKILNLYLLASGGNCDYRVWLVW